MLTGVHKNHFLTVRVFLGSTNKPGALGWKRHQGSCARLSAMPRTVRTNPTPASNSEYTPWYRQRFGCCRWPSVPWLWLCSSVVSNQLPPLGTPAEVAEYLRTTTAALAQDRYKGTGPKFIKRGSRVLYRWSDVLEWLDLNTIQRTDDLRPQR